MNRLYRLIWNVSQHCWQVVSERARGHMSRSGHGETVDATTVDSITPDIHPLKTLTTLCLMIFAGLSSAVYAAPTGCTVTTGSAGISQAGNTTTIQQNSQNVTINWNTFSSAANEAIVFNQPNSSAIALNRITGSEASSLLGSLTANGQVFIINPNGILFGAGAQVNVGGLVASTLNLSDDDFNNNNSNGNNSGHYTFASITDNNQGNITNQGNIATTTGGYVALLGKQVSNQGNIVTPEGTSLLAAGDNISLNLNNGSLVSYSVNQGTLNALAENKQLIRANGGTVILTAQAANDLATATVNNTGIIEAQSLANKNGTILLLADMQTGTVNVGGTLDASAPNGGNGGFIETSAAHVKVAEGTVVTTAEPFGLNGTWLIDPTDFYISATDPANGSSYMSNATLASNLNSGNVTIQTLAGGAGNGDIFVNDGVSWGSGNSLTLSAFRNININAPITATGTFAGLVLKYGNYAVTGATAIGTDYYVNAPVTLSGASSLGINGNFYTMINDMNDFVSINLSSGGFYALRNNIVSTDTYTDAVVGNFSGVFAGLGHTISNLNINATSQYIGLFGNNSGTIRNLGVMNGSVQSSDALVGGLVGKNTGTIRDSFFAGSVSSIGGNGVGGLTAWNHGGIIKDSYTTGTVTGNDAIGGVAGYNENSGVVQRNYSTATIASLSVGRLGGIVGANNSGTVSDSYTTSPIVGSGSSTGGGVLTSGQMKIAANFSGWDIATTGGSSSKWRIYEGEIAPLLRSFLTPITATASSATNTYSGSTFSGGSGVSYSDAGATLLGSVSYGGTSQGVRNAGTYTLTANGLYSDQLGYDIKAVDGVLMINKATLTINALADSKEYDGTTDTSGAVSSSGLLFGDSLTGISKVYDNKNAGSRTLSIAGYSLNDGNSGNNYNVVTNTDIGSISKKTIQVSGADVADKVYDGTRDATINSLTVNGLITGDDVTTTADASFDTKNEGANKNVRIFGITLSGADQSNYWMATEFLDTTASITEVAAPPSVVNSPPYDASIYSSILQSGIGARFGEQPVLPGNSGTNDPLQQVALYVDATKQPQQGQAITQHIAGLGCVLQMPKDAPIENCTVMTHVQ